jgi:hypothetical protein
MKQEQHKEQMRQRPVKASRDNKRGDRETGASRGRETCKRHQDGTEGSLREKRWRNSENEVTVPDRRRRIHLEVVLVRRWVIWVLGIWKGRVWGKGGSRGVSLQAT